MLARQGLTGQAVPGAGQRVLIQRSGNMLHDVTDRVHPSIAASAVLAARIIGLDIAGVDMVAEDIAQPLAAQQAAIVEVNAGPGLLMHLKPLTGQPRPVGQAIVQHLFPLGDSGRIPVVGIAGTHGTTLLARLLRRLLQLRGTALGMACRDGLYFGQRQVQAGSCTGWASARRVLFNRAVELAVFENDGEDLLSQGLAYDRCQVGVLTRIEAGVSLPGLGVASAEQLYRIFRTQIDVVLPGGVAVLNADDELVAQMAGLSDGEVIFYAGSLEQPRVREHLSAGGRAVVAQGE